MPASELAVEGILAGGQALVVIVAVSGRGIAELLLTQRVGVFCVHGWRSGGGVDGGAKSQRRGEDQGRTSLKKADNGRGIKRPRATRDRRSP